MIYSVEQYKKLRMNEKFYPVNRVNYGKKYDTDAEYEELKEMIKDLNVRHYLEDCQIVRLIEMDSRPPKIPVELWEKDEKGRSTPNKDFNTDKPQRTSDRQKVDPVLWVADKPECIDEEIYMGNIRYFRVTNEGKTYVFDDASPKYHMYEPNWTIRDHARNMTVRFLTKKEALYYIKTDGDLGKFVTE
jgi:hypothetical protein